MTKSTLLTWMKLPEVLQVEDLDNPENIHIIRRIIRRKSFLANTYRSFYRDILKRIRQVPARGEIVELGSGASLIKEMAPQIITSDVLPYQGVDRVFSALNMPMQNQSVSAIVMIDVLHHIQDSRKFFHELDRCLIPGGKVVMIEPANTVFSRWIYQNFHHEPFNTRGGWGFSEGGPLSGANMAIPWIVFGRDRKQFEHEFPTLKIQDIQTHTPFKYLISGGLSFKQLLPSQCYALVQFIEWILTPLNPYMGLFMTIELTKEHHS
jgi:SAM-dependent methyltransferase